MTVEGLIAKGSGQVRNNSDLTALYLKFYENEFGYKPACSSCNFEYEFQIFANRILNKTNLDLFTMTNQKTHKFYGSGEIKAYDVEQGNLNSRVYFNDYSATDALAIAYLTQGTPEELEARKLEFKILPEGLGKEVKTEDATEDVVKKEKVKK
jgi:hypothetical protein